MVLNNPIDGWQFMIELNHLYRDITRTIEHQTGMSQTRLQILHELFYSEELSQAELHHRLGVEGAVISRIVKQLEATGLVTRRADPQDNRFTLVALSSEAHHLPVATDILAFKETLRSQLLDGLNETEREQLLHLLKHIQENARAMEDISPDGA